MPSDDESTHRLFAGIALDDAARSACAGAAERLARTGFAAKFEDASKMHVTLAFLGNVGASRVDDAVNALRACAQRAPFAVRLDKVGAFPHERKPRVVYVGAREQGAPYRALADAAKNAYGELGFAFKDDSVVHVTIARVKDPRRPLPLVEFEPAELRVEQLTLFESIFDKERNTSRYEIRATAPLAHMPKGS